MTRRKKIQESYTAVFVLLFLVVAMMCFLVNMPRSGTVGESYLDVSASMPNNYDIMIMQGNSEYLVLVNKTYGLGSAYEPADLETVASRASDRPAKFQKLRAAAADSFNKMTTDAEEKGLTIAVTTAYRPYSYQKQLYDNYMKSNGAEWTEHYSAEPGHSEHQTGLTADVSCPAVDYELTADFADTAEGKWLAENAHRYGFIIRYPDGKEAITGYKYEPWHIRYVGEQAATEIYNRNLTLEEYLGEV